MNISFSGYNKNVLTFEYCGDLKAGDFVEMYKSGVVKKAYTDSNFFGKCISTRDNYAAIQTDGYVEANKIGTIFAGYNNLVVGANGIKVVDNIIKHQYGCLIPRLVIYVDDTTVGFIL